MKLSIVLATRSRPGLLVRTVEETLRHIGDQDTKLVICGDDDDVATLGTKGRLNDPRIIWSIAPRPAGLGEKYNRVLTVAPADVYLCMVDYAPHVTPGFDTKILEAAQVYPDGYCVVLNHLANLSFSQINAVTDKLARAMGGIYSEEFPFWFVDHYLEEMARRIGRQVFVDVWIDASQRPGTMNKHEPSFWGIYFGWLEEERRKVADAIIDAPDFDETPARKQALKRNYQLWNEWSGIINNLLQHDQGAEVDRDDPLYMGLRNRAEKLMRERIAACQAKQKAAA